VMVVSVPWQLKSSERVVERPEMTPGAFRRAYGPAPRDDRPAAPSPASARSRPDAGEGAEGRSDGARAGAGRPRS
jgi:hypothetical protein